MRTAFTNPESRQPADLYRMEGPIAHELDPELLDRLVELRRLGLELAVRRSDRESGDDHRRKTYDGPTVDSELAQAGITFDGTRSLWLAYERETRRLVAQEPNEDAEDHRSAA